MRVGIFVLTPGRRGGGPETYEIQFLRALAKLDRENQYFIYCTTPKAIPAIGIRQDNFTYRVLRPGARWVSIPITLPLLLIKDRIDFYHATVAPPPFSPKPFVLSILCASNWVHPEFYPKAVVWRLNRLIAAGLKNAKWLLPISQDLLEDVHEMWKIPKERMTVAYMGVGPEFTARPANAARQVVSDKYGLKERYLVFIGQQQERKNVFRVIEAYRLFRDRAGSAALLPRLVLVGREPSQDDAIQSAIRKNDIEAFTTRVAYVAFGDLPDLYAAAEMLVFPSLWEGFGLPVVEAMACGTPVVTSTATCLPEVAGDAALVVDPESSNAIADAMLQIYEDKELRASLVERGFKRAKYFTWEACARATLNVYKGMPIRGSSLPQRTEEKKIA